MTGVISQKVVKIYTCQKLTFAPTSAFIIIHDLFLFIFKLPVQQTYKNPQYLTHLK